MSANALASKWKLWTLAEALQLAAERGVGLEQAKADLKRALKRKAQQIDGAWVGLRATRSPAPADDLWRIDPELNFERSTVVARVREQSAQISAPPGSWEELEQRRRASAGAIVTKPVEIWVYREDLDWLWPDDAPTGKRRGRSPSYDWPTFEREARRFSDFNGGIAPSVDPGPKGFKKADIAAHMAGWCDANWGDCPSDSMIKDHVNKALASSDA